MLRRNDDEEELVERLVRGEVLAQHQFFKAYAPQVSRLVVRMLGRAEGRVDLVNEVFAALLRDIHTLREASELGRWVTSVTINHCRNHLRAARRRSWLQFMAPAELPEVPGSGEEGLERAVSRATYRVLDRLGADERIALVLRFIEGLPIADAARACGVSVATFNRRLARARESFMQHSSQDPVLSEWLEEGAP